MYFLCSRTLPKDCQMLLFSATYDDDVMKFAKTVVPDPIIIRLRREEESLDNIKQYYVVCRDKEDKFQALSNMYGVVSIGQCIVFCQVSVKINSFPPPPFFFHLSPDSHSNSSLPQETTVKRLKFQLLFGQFFVTPGCFYICVCLCHFRLGRPPLGWQRR